MPLFRELPELESTPAMYFVVTTLHLFRSQSHDVQPDDTINEVRRGVLKIASPSLHLPLFTTEQRRTVLPDRNDMI